MLFVLKIPPTGVLFSINNLTVVLLILVKPCEFTLMKDLRYTV